MPAELDVHVVLDNSSTHKTPAIHDWLLRHPRFTFHFTPTSVSWLNLVERWFAELTNKMLRRSAHQSVTALTADLNAWIAAWNDNPRPFVWHKTADEILDSLKRYLNEPLTQDTSGPSRKSSWRLAGQIRRRTSSSSSPQPWLRLPPASSPATNLTRRYIHGTSASAH